MSSSLQANSIYFSISPLTIISTHSVEQNILFHDLSWIFVNSEYKIE